jgi:hypothetical protein
MSGYLKRIAAAAVKPERRVHPFVRPLYQPSSEPVSQTVEMITERVRESAPGVTQAREGLNSPTRRNHAAMERESEEQQASGPTSRQGRGEAQRNRFEALLPEVLQDASAGMAHTRFRDDAIRHEAPEVQRRDRQRDDQRAAGTRRFEPLVRPERETDESAQLPGDRKAVHSGTSSVALREQESQSHKDETSGARRVRSATELGAGRRQTQQQAIARAAQRSDEIQIHIGRIEVTAMPPVAPRPVLAPVRKSETLDEYLRQRNGRAG